jgi:hypothetical protein
LGSIGVGAATHTSAAGRIPADHTGNELDDKINDSARHVASSFRSVKLLLQVVRYLAAAGSKLVHHLLV